MPAGNMHMKKLFIYFITTGVILLKISSLSAGGSYPEFNLKYWENSQDAAKGKIFRGTGLTVLGLAAIIPSAIWLDKSFDNPHKFMALGAVASVAAVSMTLHGINSITFGIEQKHKAGEFITGYKSDNQVTDIEQEREYYIYAAQKSTAKLIAFGAVLSVQSAMLLANGVVLSVMKAGDRSIGGAQLWPSYLFGSMMLAGGIFMIIKNVKKYKELDQLALTTDISAGAVSFSPWFYRDKTASSISLGLTGQFVF
jgi:hypothetical protein